MATTPSRTTSILRAAIYGRDAADMILLRRGGNDADDRATGHWITLEGQHIFLAGPRPSDSAGRKARFHQVAAEFHRKEAGKATDDFEKSYHKKSAAIHDIHARAQGEIATLTGEAVPKADKPYEPSKAVADKHAEAMGKTKKPDAKDSEPRQPPQPTKPNPTASGKAAEKKEPAPAPTPREKAAEETAKMMASDYAFARQSAVGNVGEDLANSARHKRNAWRGLADAEANGTAAQLVTREKLMENEPHQLAQHIEANPHTALAMHYAIKAFPAKPGYKARIAGMDIKDRQQFVEAYRQYKAKAEELAKTEQNPMQAMNKLREFTSAKIKELRGIKSDDSIGRATATDAFNNTANALVNTAKELDISRPAKMSIIGRTIDFAKAGTQKYGLNVFGPRPTTPEGLNEVRGKLDAINGHMKDVMDGKSLPESFGLQSNASDGPKKFSAAEMYVGKAERKGGRDVSQFATDPNAATSHLVDKFKMRGVQWGNSVSDDERTHHAGHVVGALTDLAEVTGLKPEDISLNGKLGLAIGARGHGVASAHYEPGSKVINLTRANGVGTIAHEWGHAFDHDLGGGGITSNGVKSGGDYQSMKVDDKQFVKDAEGSYKVDDKGQLITKDLAASNPIHAAMNGVRGAMKSSGFNDRVRREAQTMVNQGAMSKDKAQNYWLANHEKFARSFEQHVQHKLHEGARENTYLAGVSGGGGLWPTKEESAHMAPHFDNLLAAYRQRKYGSPDVQRFSRSDAFRIIAMSLKSPGAIAALRAARFGLTLPH